MARKSHRVKGCGRIDNSLVIKKAFEIHREETGEPWIVYMYAGGDQFIELFYGATKDIPYKDEVI